MNKTPELYVKFPKSFIPLWYPHRYKVYYGGRGAAKSVQYADALLFKTYSKKLRVLCTREFQSSIADSVYRLLIDRIAYWKMEKHFNVILNRITSGRGSEFIFKGLHHNMNEIKSTEGINVCWIEEAQSVSKESWDILIPTIREEGSEIWVSFNTGEVDDPTYQRFVVNPPPDSIVKKVSYRNNPYFPEVLRKEMEYLKRVDPEAYDNVWEGNPKHISDALVFKGKYIIRTFDEPENVQFYYGADWGFGPDPTTLGRCWIKDNCLYIDYEAYALGCELDEISALFDLVPGSRVWPINADDSRPETISYTKKKGFNIRGVPKNWKRDDAKADAKGSIEEGITYLRKFEQIIIHERCKHTAQEFGLYRYKTQDVGGIKTILPIIVDADNHMIDQLRYALQPLIRQGFNWETFL
jgi:phage terminase large subunit